MEQQFEKLEENIKDDDKIVTITSFAIEANLSLEESKKIIEKYVEINKESKEISVTYILNGKIKGEDLLSVSLVKDGSLEEEKQLFKDDVKQTIFSIQKAKNIDFIVIALADSVLNDERKDPLKGSIVGRKCVKRILKKKVLPTIAPATIRGKSTIFTKQNSTIKAEGQKTEKEDKEINQNIKSKANTQGNIASLFNKAAQNKKTEQKDNKPQEKKQKVNGKLSNFFTKQSSNDVLIKKEQNKKEASKKGNLNKTVDMIDDDTDDAILMDLEVNSDTAKKSNNSNRKKEMEESNRNNKKPDLFDSDTDEDILKDLEIKKEVMTEKKDEKKKEQAKINQSKKKSSQKKKRPKNDIGNDKAAKKRKRIIVDESDSDDIFESDKSDSEDVVEKSDEEQEAVKMDKKPLPPKNKRRKAVEKMYEDEDGYLVTKTEYVYETPSEDENEPDNKIPKVEEKPKLKIEKNSNSENEISPNKGAKSKKGANKKAPAANQPTLMNFFKKK